MGSEDDPDYDSPSPMLQSTARKQPSTLLGYWKRAAEKIGVEINITKDLRGACACDVVAC